jgi:hypothetical protein
MTLDPIHTSLRDRLPLVRGKYLDNVALKKYTWFGVGGRGRFERFFAKQAE